jgi:hypothetical protein
MFETIHDENDDVEQSDSDIVVDAVQVKRILWRAMAHGTDLV